MELNDHVKYIFQDCNINFLIGSGLSNPFFGTLGRIEIWLEGLEENLRNDTISDKVYSYVKASLYKAYFDVAMADNIDVKDYIDHSGEYLEHINTDSTSVTYNKKLNNTYQAYKDFLNTINDILYKRRNNTINKQVNLFTTNIDVFLEKIIEDLDLQFNDGFNGVFAKKFSLRNFKKSYYQKSLQYDNVSEIPVFNLLKIHGSLTWEMKKSSITFSNLELIENIKKEIDKIDLIEIIETNNKCWEQRDRDLTIDEIISLSEIDDDKVPDVEDFIENYNKLQIVNPTKEKFKDTTFNKTYYELLRLYANEMEKENSALFVMGFSMADEHLREITLRAIKSNPTLKVFLVSYSQSASDIKENFLKDEVDINDIHNVQFISPNDGFDLKSFNEQIIIPVLKEINLS